MGSGRNTASVGVFVIVIMIGVGSFAIYRHQSSAKKMAHRIRTDQKIANRLIEESFELTNHRPSPIISPDNSSAIRILQDSLEGRRLVNEFRTGEEGRLDLRIIKDAANRNHSICSVMQAGNNIGTEAGRLGLNMQNKVEHSSAAINVNVQSTMARTGKEKSRAVEVSALTKVESHADDAAQDITVEHQDFIIEGREKQALRQEEQAEQKKEEAEVAEAKTVKAEQPPSPAPRTAVKKPGGIAMAVATGFAILKSIF